VNWGVPEFGDFGRLEFSYFSESDEGTLFMAFWFCCSSSRDLTVSFIFFAVLNIVGRLSSLLRHPNFIG